MSFRQSMKAALVALVLITGLPAAAWAQSAFAGVVRDTSGAVMPGVTVEAASPVLIEKVRSAITDENGAYRIVDLRPGTYTLTFGKHPNVSLAVIVRFTDANPDVRGTPDEVREVVGTAENATLEVPYGSISGVTFVFRVPPLDQLNKIAAVTILYLRIFPTNCQTTVVTHKWATVVAVRWTKKVVHQDLKASATYADWWSL